MQASSLPQHPPPPYCRAAGHRVKSLSNPDKRVVLIKDFVFAHFPSTDLLKYAVEVEAVTTQKKENLILNVDGAIAVAFVDLLRGCGAFTREEADEVVKSVRGVEGSGAAG